MILYLINSNGGIHTKMVEAWKPIMLRVNELTYQSTRYNVILHRDKYTIYEEIV